jgi:hypothetical protein
MALIKLRIRALAFLEAKIKGWDFPTSFMTHGSSFDTEAGKGF